MARQALSIDIEITPKPALIVGGFFRAANSFKDFKEPLEIAIRDVVSPAINHNFEVEGIPSWTPLADVTYQKRKYPGKPILQQSGTLKDIATSLRPWSIDNNEAFLLATSLGEAYYGAIHESGSIWMVSRPWSTIQDAEEQEIEEIFRDHSLGRILKFSIVGTLVGGAIRRFFGRRS